MPTQLLINEATIYGAAHSGVARYMRYVIEAAGTHYGAGLAVCSEHRLAPPPARWIPSPRFRGHGRLHTTDVVATAASLLLRPRVYFGGYYGIARTGAKEVFTVYDLMHEMYAPPNPDRLLRRSLDEKRRCLERAAALIAISHNSAADIVRFYPHVDASKIVVTHLGVDAIFFSGTRRDVSRPYFIFVGIRHGAKNFRRLIEAFGACGMASAFDLLVVSRGGPFNDDERETMRRCGVETSVKLIPPVPDGELANLYAGSAGLLYPSEYEGFGLPVLEAMAAGTIVATSSTSSLPEVGGDVPFYFDPHDVSSIAAAIRAVGNLSEHERGERRRAGIERAGTFTWQRCMAQTMEVFDRLLSSS